MAKKPALGGQGLEALMGSGYTTPPRYSGAQAQPQSSTNGEPDGTVRASHVYQVEIDKIEVNPYQPRTEFRDEELAELAESIGRLGLIQPITVRYMDGKFQIISGERRFRAAKQAGLSEIPAYVLEADEQGMAEMSLVENIQRADLNAMEIALSLQRLMEEFQLRQDDVAARIGKDRTTVSNYIRLLKLPYDVQHALKQRMISMGHARAILSLERKEDQLALMQRIIEEGLSVRAVEEIVRSMEAAAPATDQDSTEVAVSNEGASSQEEASVPEMLQMLESKLGWGVSVKPGAKGAGRIVISYRSEGERLELMRKFGSIPE